MAIRGCELEEGALDRPLRARRTTAEEGERRERGGERKGSKAPFAPRAKRGLGAEISAGESAGARGEIHEASKAG